jgi:SAM-dependent methyltransferase
MSFGIRKSMAVFTFKCRNRHKETFDCPLCGYHGPFRDYQSTDGLRRHAQCPNCAALERHRIQRVVLEAVFRQRETAHWRVLHVAPEACFRPFFSQRVGRYETADLKLPGVDHTVDLLHLPFADATYDFVFASHVLEHIPDDHRALSEIRRILKPNGMAMLPVPIVAERTAEYAEPNPHEFGHVRAPGLDYFARYERHFSKVDRFSSEGLPAHFQLFLYEDRSHWPTRESPCRAAMVGEKFPDFVPVCYV